MVNPDEADPNIKHCLFLPVSALSSFDVCILISSAEHGTDKGALKELPKPFVNNPEEMEKTYV